MLFDQSEIQAFKDSARDFLARENQGERVRALVNKGGAVDRRFWQQAAEVGWTGLLVPEDHGGLDLGLPATIAIAEEAGRAYIADPLLPVAVLAASLLRELPSGALRDSLLAGIAEGKSLAGVAWQRRLGQVDAGDVPADVRRAEGAWILDAKYVAVSPAQSAEGWVVLAQREGEPILVWIPASSPGVEVAPHARVDGAEAGSLVLNACRFEESQVLAIGASVLGWLNAALDTTRIAQAAQLLGVARQSFESTLDYMNVRVQFGKPIGSFQALQHRMVDAYIQIQLLDYSLAQAVSQLSQGQGKRSVWASRLKVRAEAASQFMTRLAVQIHGGMGYSDESDIGLGLKRALALSADLGNARVHRKRYFSEAQLAVLPQTTQDVDLDAEEWTEFPKEADWDAMPEDTFRRMLRAFFARFYPEELRHKKSRLHWHQIEGWYKTLSRQGWIAPAWPKEYGGMALSPNKMIAYIEEQERYGVGRPPDQGLVMLGPILFRFGTAEQREKYLPPILTGEHVWAQGYSEPNAGSDLASLRCEAVLDGDHFIVNGQKTWSTLAQDATHMFMLVRTDKMVKKQAGISFLMVDLSSPGVRVRPIKTIAGDAEFCEVFFDDVRVPKENLVGELNQGWTISKALLGFERLFSGSPKHCQSTLAAIDKIAVHGDLFDDVAFADAYAQLHIDVADLSAAYATFADMVRRGEALPANVSLLKVWATETHERTALLLLDAARDYAAYTGAVSMVSDDGSTLEIDGVQLPLFNSAAAKIFSGTNEIQRNILAKVVLNLPT